MVLAVHPKGGMVKWFDHRTAKQSVPGSMPAVGIKFFSEGFVPEVSIPPALEACRRVIDPQNARQILVGIRKQILVLQRSRMQNADLCTAKMTNTYLSTAWSEHQARISDLSHEYDRPS